MLFPTAPAILSQVLLRWNVQRGVAVLPKASSPAHVADNIEGLFDWRLTYDQKVRRPKTMCRFSNTPSQNKPVTLSY